MLKPIRFFSAWLLRWFPWCCFPCFITISCCFPWCLRMFLPVFLQFRWVFPLSVSPIPISDSANFNLPHLNLRRSMFCFNRIYTRRKWLLNHQEDLLQGYYYYYGNGKNVSITSTKFKVDRKQIRNWLKSEKLIQKQKWTSWSTRHGKVMFAIMEKELYKRFIDTRKEGNGISWWWFNTQAKQIMSETYPEHIKEIKYCYEGKGHASQKTP